jgi:hypothetical protein
MLMKIKSRKTELDIERALKSLSVSAKDGRSGIRVYHNRSLAWRTLLTFHENLSEIAVLRAFALSAVPTPPTGGETCFLHQ